MQCGVVLGVVADVVSSGFKWCLGVVVIVSGELAMSGGGVRGTGLI